MKIRKLIQGIFICAAMLNLAACSSDSSSGDGYITYDDFTGTSISTTKWSEDDVGAGGTVSIVNNAFQAEMIADGSLSTVNARLQMADASDSGSVTGIEVNINVSEATDTQGRIRARLQGTFYNDGTVSGAATGSAVSDIHAIIEIADFSGTTGTAKYFVLRCTNSDCSTNDPSEASGTLGNVELLEDHTFQIEFDSSTSTFTFTMDSVTTVTTDVTASAAYSADTNLPFVKIGIRGGGTPIGSMTATFDDFRCKGCTLP